MSSWLCDDAELISGAWLTSAYAGHGVLAEDIPATGVHGASVLYDQVALPGDAGKEVRGLILTQPSGLTTWQHGEDGTITAEGPDGAYTYTMQVYVDGVALGSPVTITLTFGAGSMALGMTGGSGTLNVNGSAVPVVSIAITGGVGALSVSAQSAALVAVARSGGSGTLLVSAAGAALMSAEITGGSGALLAAAAGSAISIAPESRCLILPHEGREFTLPLERRVLTLPREQRVLTLRP